MPNNPTPPTPQYADPYDPRIGNGGLPSNIWGAQNRAYLQKPDQNQYVDAQLNRITANNSPYLNQVRNAANASSFARGAGVGGSSYAQGNAAAAAIRAAMPMAQQNAQTEAQAAQSNQQWLNQRDLADTQASAQMSSSAYAASAQAEIARAQMANQLQMQREQLAYGGEQAGLNRTYEQFMANQGQGYGMQNMAAQNYYGLQNLGAQAYYNQQQNQQNWLNNTYGNTIGTVLNGIMSNPDYFNDPSSALGMVNGFSDYIGQLLNQWGRGP